MSKVVDKGGGSGKINSGANSGAKKTSGWQERHAKMMYQEIAKRTTDCDKIAQATGFPVSDIEMIKRHLFIDEHRFRDGSIKKFDPDFEQAQAWDRLTQGKHTDLDLLLLRHELEEAILMKEQNLAYEDAHERANQKYNWWREFLKREE